MNTLNVLAELWGFFLVVIGLPLLVNPKIGKELLKSLKSELVTFYLGAFVFMLGIATLLTYNSWATNWGLLITIIGWLSIIKGVFLSFFPGVSTKMYSKLLNEKAMQFSYIIAILLGIFLIYMGFVA